MINRCYQNHTILLSFPCVYSGLPHGPYILSSSVIYGPESPFFKLCWIAVFALQNYANTAACRPNPKRLAFFSHFSGLFLEKSPFRLFRNFFLQIFALFRPLDCDFILCPLLTLNFVLFTSSEQSDSLNRVTFSLIFEKIEWTCSCPHLETLIFCLEKCKEHFWPFLDFFFQGNSGILPFKKKAKSIF